MPRTQQRIQGRRTVRHVVLVTPDQEQRLQDRAATLGVTVAKLLADSALGDLPQIKRTTLLRELAAAREMVNHAIGQRRPDLAQQTGDSLSDMDFRIAGS